MSMNVPDLQSLLAHELKDLYSAEKQLLKALPKMAKAANSAELRAAFDAHLDETRQHVERLEAAFSQLDHRPGGEHCNAMEGLIAESADVIGDATMPATVKDVALTCAAQRIEHYEIAGYGCALELTNLLDLPEAGRLLQATLDEEYAADKKLTTITHAVVGAARALA